MSARADTHARPFCLTRSCFFFFFLVFAGSHTYFFDMNYDHTERKLCEQSESLSSHSSSPSHLCSLVPFLRIGCIWPGSQGR